MRQCPCVSDLSRNSIEQRRARRSSPTIANGFYHGATEGSRMLTRNINLTPEMDLSVDAKIQSGQ